MYVGKNVVKTHYNNSCAEHDQHKKLYAGNVYESGGGVVNFCMTKENSE